jgi:hypothetical protein
MPPLILLILMNLIHLLQPWFQLFTLRHLCLHRLRFQLRVNYLDSSPSPFSFFVSPSAQDNPTSILTIEILVYLYFSIEILVCVFEWNWFHVFHCLNFIRLNPISWIGDSLYFADFNWISNLIKKNEIYVVNRSYFDGSKLGILK